MDHDAFETKIPGDRVSMVFGEIRNALPEEIRLLDRMVDRSPHDVFSALNRKLNQRHLCLSIDVLRDEES